MQFAIEFLSSRPANVAFGATVQRDREAIEHWLRLNLAFSCDNGPIILFLGHACLPVISCSPKEDDDDGRPRVSNDGKFVDESIVGKAEAEEPRRRLDRL